MQEIAFPGFKFQKFSGDYPSNIILVNLLDSDWLKTVPINL
jgi:hypothetical protein